MGPGSPLQHRGPGQSIPSVGHELAEVSIVCSDHSPFVEVNCGFQPTDLNQQGHTSLSLCRVVLIWTDSEGRGFGVTVE